MVGAQPASDPCHRPPRRRNNGRPVGQPTAPLRARASHAETRFAANGDCRRGEACPFAHGSSELVPLPNFYRTRLCAEYRLSGSCHRGDRCTYAHGQHELCGMTRGGHPAAAGGGAGGSAPAMGGSRFGVAPQEMAMRCVGAREPHVSRGSPPAASSPPRADVSTVPGQNEHSTARAQSA